MLAPSYLQLGDLISWSSSSWRPRRSSILCRMQILDLTHLYAMPPVDYVGIRRMKRTVSTVKALADILWRVGTNLIHDFTAVTFSVKLTYFREKRWFPWNPWFFVNFSAFSLIYDNSRVLSAAFVRMLLFTTCRTLALSSWHDCLESWLSVVNIRCSEISSFALAQHLEITSVWPVNFRNSFREFSVKFDTF